jgi:hypothetical protein
MHDADSGPGASIRADRHPSFQVRPCHTAIVLLFASPLYLIAPVDAPEPHGGAGAAQARAGDDVSVAWAPSHLASATLVQMSPGLDSLSAREELPPGFVEAGHVYLGPDASPADAVEPIPIGDGLTRHRFTDGHDGP